MPESVIPSKADRALASSAAGTFLRSTGPTEVPELTAITPADVSPAPNTIEIKRGGIIELRYASGLTETIKTKNPDRSVRIERSGTGSDTSIITFSKVRIDEVVE